MENEEKLINKDFSGKKLLIVDDDPIDIKETMTSLKPLNFETIDISTTGQECLDLIKRGSEYDVILLDLMMPVMDGQKILNELKKNEDFKTPVIALTSDKEWFKTFKPTGFADYLQKPFDTERLKEKLTNVFEHPEEVKEEKVEEKEEIKELDNKVEVPTPTPAEPKEEKPKPIKKKKFNIIGYFFLMLVIFVVLETIAEILAGIPTTAAFTSKYGQQMIGELFWGMSMLFIVLMFGNSYIFTEKKEGLIKSITHGAPILILGLLVLVGNISEIAPTISSKAGLINVVALLIYCVFIGITEEFMCRAWLQNEFIERYGKTRKQVIISIILASLVFGAIHFSNILMGQTVIETIAQVIHATAAGMIFGAIYYRTKNIWSVAALHAFWDFAIFLGELNIIKDCTYGDPTTGVLIYNIAGILPLVIMHIITFIVLVRKSKILPLVAQGYVPDETMKKKDDKLKLTLIIVGVISYFALTAIVNLFATSINKELEEYTTCYEYKNIKLDKENFEVHTPYFDKYTITKEIDLPCDETDEVTGDGVVERKFEKKTLFFEIGRENATDAKYISIKTNNDYEHKLTFEDNIIDRYFVVEHDGFMYIVVNVIDEKDNGSMIYFAKVSMENFDETATYVDSIEKEFKTFKLPEIYRISYITYTDKSDLNPYFVGDYYTFLINNEGEILVIDEE